MVYFFKSNSSLKRYVFFLTINSNNVFFGNLEKATHSNN